MVCVFQGICLFHLSCWIYCHKVVQIEAQPVFSVCRVCSFLCISAHWTQAMRNTSISSSPPEPAFPFTEKIKQPGLQRTQQVLPSPGQHPAVPPGPHPSTHPVTLATSLGSRGQQPPLSSCVLLTCVAGPPWGVEWLSVPGATAQDQETLAGPSPAGGRCAL